MYETMAMTKSVFPKECKCITFQLYPDLLACWYGDVKDDLIYIYEPKDKKKRNPLCIAIKSFDEIAHCKIVEII